MDDESRVRVSDAEREAIVARLNSATGEGRLTLAEFGERAGQAYGARTRSDLAKLVDDLPAENALAVPDPAATAVATAAGTPRRPVASQTIPVGAIKRSGRWRLDRDTELGTVLGTVKLDLRQADVAASDVELRVHTILGAVKIWIPRGVRVEVDGASVVGTRQVEESSGDSYPGAPLLRLRVDTVLGSVKVYRV